MSERKCYVLIERNDIGRWCIRYIAHSRNDAVMFRDTQRMRGDTRIITSQPDDIDAAIRRMEAECNRRTVAYRKRGERP